MGHIPVRDSAGRIVDMVDAREAAAVAEEEPEQADTSLEAAAPNDSDRSTAPLAPDAQRPMAELLGRVRKGGDARRPQPWQNSAAEATIGVLVALAMVALLLGRPLPPTQPQLTGSPTPTATAETQAATAVTAGVDERLPQLARAVVAYAAPGGPIVGALEPGRLDDNWLQLDVAQSGRVWVVADELDASAESVTRLPDLATPTLEPAPIPVVAPLLPVAERAPIQRCTPERVVAVVSDGVTDVWSCLSVEDALATLPHGQVVAGNPAAAQAYLARLHEDQTAIAPLTQP
jgi:hypothetical protein